MGRAAIDGEGRRDGGRGRLGAVAPVLLAAVIPLLVLAGTEARAAVAHIFAPRPSYGAPPATYIAVMAWDGARNQVVMATGPGGHPVSDASTWTWDGTGWVQHAGSFQPPVGQRFPVTTAYDPSRKMVVAVVADFGSLGPADTWTWNGAAWQQAGGGGDFVIQGGAALGYDNAHHQLVLASTDAHDDELLHTWVWRGSEWAAVPMTSTFVNPGPLHLAFDQATGRLLLFPTALSQVSNDCVPPIGAVADSPFTGCLPQVHPCVGCAVHPLAWTGSAWVPSGMTARDGVAVADPTGNGLLDIVDGDATTRGVWRWDGRQWGRVAGLPVPPKVCCWNVAVDPDAQQLLLFGGEETNGGWSAREVPTDETWTFDGHAWAMRAGRPLPTLPPPATPPPPPPCAGSPASVQVAQTPSGGVFLSIHLPITGQPGSCTEVAASLRLVTTSGTPLAVQGSPAVLGAASPYGVALGSASATWSNWCGQRTGVLVQLTGAGFMVSQPVTSPPVCASRRSPSTLTVFRPIAEP